MTRPLRTHAELTPPSPVDVAVTTSIGAHGEAVTLWAEPGRSNGGPVPVWVTVQHQHTMMNTVRIEALSFTAPHVQSLPDDRVLVVGHGQAQVFDASGSLVRSADVGDGVTHVAATPSGNVWVANAEGLVRFGADLTPQCSLPGAAGVFTLNVHGETAWACHEPDSPIIRVAGDVLTSWHNRVTGSAAMLVGADAVALVDGARIVLGQLTGSAFEPVAEVGLALPSNAQLHGRDDVLHVFAGTAWYRLDLDDIM
jgi:hypothetical protein